MTHPNEELIRRGYEAFSAGDVNTVLALFADDITWHASGSNQLAGDYHGPQEVMGMFGRLMEMTGGSFRVDVHDILANDTHGVVLVTTRAERDGQMLASRRVDIWHVADGKATEFWAFAEDQAKLDQFYG
jgi:uncharacterized protein